MKRWYELNPPIYTYNPQLKVNPENVELSNNLSPLTNFFLNAFVNAIDERNLIIAIPDVILRPVSIAMYLYAKLKTKSAVIFGGENTCDFHHKNYYLLNQHPGEYLFYSVPQGFISEEGIEAKVYLPRAKRDFRQRYIQHLEKNFLDSHNPKILVSQDDRKIDFVIERLVTDERAFYNPITIDIGLIIFENIDRFVYSQYSTELFLKWLSPLDREIRFIFHFSNPESKFIKTIKEATNSLVVPFGTSILRTNVELQRKSIEYFRKIFEDERKGELINKYNIDREYLYKNITSVEIVELRAGNIDYHVDKAREVLSRVDENEIKNKKLYYTVKSLLYKLPNLIINPSKYKEPYGDNFVRWGRYTIPRLLGMLRERIPEEDKGNIVFLEDLISEVYCVYSELKECRRYGEGKTYSRIAKDYKVLEIIEKACKEENGNKIVIATQSPSERNILEGNIDDLKLKNEVDVETIHQTNMTPFDCPKATLVLPGRIYMKYLSILLQPFKKIIILAYEGENYNIVKEQIELFYTYSFEQEETLMSYLEEIYNFLGVPRDTLFRDYLRRREQSVEEEVQTQPEGEGREAELLDRLREIVETEPRYKHYKEYEDEISKIEGIITEIEEKETDIEKIGPFYKVSLRKMDETQIISKLLPAEKTYIYLEESGEIQEGSPRNLKRGFHIVILDNDERKTLLDLIIEIFDLEQTVDKYLIGLWKERLMQFIEKYELSYADFHRLYIGNEGKREYQTVLNWAKGNVFAPEDPNDLLAIGKILKDAEIIEDYQAIDREVSKLRIRHRIIGRKLRKIVKEILRGEIDISKLSYEEYTLYAKIEKGLYEVVKIEMRNSGE
jgi:hypothetical protein